MNPVSSKPIVGVVGGIGSGKTHVARMLAQRAGFLISGDELGHEALRQPEILTGVVQRWGDQVLDEKGAIRRRALGRIVFADPKELRALEDMVFPFIGGRIREEIARAERNPAVAHIVLDAAVMLEAGWDEVLDLLVFVEASAEVRRLRLRESRGWEEGELERRERSQMPLDRKRRRADLIVRNEGDASTLQEDLAAVLERLQESGGRRGESGGAVGAGGADVK